MRMDELPDDIETLKRLIIERDLQVQVQRDEIQLHRDEVQAHRDEIHAQRLLIEKLKLQIARFRRIQFGRSSERHNERVAQL